MLGITAHASNEPHDGYRVRHHGKCILIFGSVPLAAMAKVAKLVPRNSVMDPDVARMFKANFAMGPAAELDRMRLERADTAKREMRLRFPTIPASAADWLAAGEVGRSSAFALVWSLDLRGMQNTYHPATGSITPAPVDPDDLRRVRLMLEAVPEAAAAFQARMPSASAEWAALAEVWGRLCATMDEEAPGWRSRDSSAACPRTFALMRQIHAPPPVAP